ncbi:MAG TPA: hypothetical protein VJX66_31995 [Amycolatopsis sp.]|nr:hypothetical protein [Amycolatopsis sp.]
MATVSVNIDLRVVAVRAHCEVCGAQVAPKGDGCIERAAAWAQSHRRPVVDEADVNTGNGYRLGTWRRRD